MPPLLGELGGGRELVEQPPGVGVALAIPDHLGVAHLRLRLGEAGLDLLDQRLDHPAPEHRRGGRPQRPPAALHDPSRPA